MNHTGNGTSRPGSSNTKDFPVFVAVH